MKLWHPERNGVPSDRSSSLGWGNEGSLDMGSKIRFCLLFSAAAVLPSPCAILAQTPFSLTRAPQAQVTTLTQPVISVSRLSR